MDDKRIDLVKVVVEPKEESNLEQDNTESEITEE